VCIVMHTGLTVSPICLLAALYCIVLFLLFVLVRKYVMSTCISGSADFVIGH